MSTHDYTLVQERGNRIRLHRPDCSLVNEARRNGNPLVTLFGCEREPPTKNLLRCSCLEDRR